MSMGFMTQKTEDLYLSSCSGTYDSSLSSHTQRLKLLLGFQFPLPHLSYKPIHIPMSSLLFQPVRISDSPVPVRPSLIPLASFCKKQLRYFVPEGPPPLQSFHNMILTHSFSSCITYIDGVCLRCHRADILSQDLEELTSVLFSIPPNHITMCFILSPVKWGY